MDPPPSIPAAVVTTALPITATANATTPAATTIQLNYADSVDSSPRSRNADPWIDEPLPPIPGAKLRLMCSFGGHIIPRPHDKSLCYVGGETRIVVVDRNSPLSDLCARLSRSLLKGRPFTLKYQLPNEDLDSLISVTTDEDLENMVEEYDRLTAASPLKSSRLRLFLFFPKPETAASMGSLLDDAKSETWFVDALNNAALINRGLSDSATMDCLVNLDGVPNSDSCNNLEAKNNEDQFSDNKQVKSLHAVQSMPDSSIVENSSSYSPSSCSPSMSNLPPIRLRIDDSAPRIQEEQRIGIEEQFAQVTFGTNGIKLDDGFGVSSIPMPPIPTATNLAQPLAVNVHGDNANSVFSDDDKSDKGARVGFRKPPLPLQPMQMQTRTSGGYSLPSPDSVASDSSIASANSYSKPKENRLPASPDSGVDVSDSNLGIQTQQVQDSGYTTAPKSDQHRQQQPQYVQASTHYIYHPAATGSPVPMSSYYPVYAPPPSQQQGHPPIDQQYPVYVMPVAPSQPYNMSLHANMAEPTVVTSSRPVNIPPQNPAIVAASAAYKECTPPIYPNKTTASPAMPEMTTNVYKTAVTSNPAMVQIPPNQYQQPYVGFSQMHHHPPQSINAGPMSSGNPNYGYEYVTPSQDQVYYTQVQQHQAAPVPPQYQSMNPAAAAAAAALSDAAKQAAADNIQQQIRTPQPL